MAKIDDVFGKVPEQILATWGQEFTYIKTGAATYNPTTGQTTSSDTNVTVRGVITSINTNESKGLYQTTDVKVIIGTAELGNYYPTESDRMQYPQAGVTREGKVLNVSTARGDNPIFHTLIVRPQ